jgi:hypothetical protein
VGIGAIAGGFLLQALIGAPNQASIGIGIIVAGTLPLAVAITLLPICVDHTAVLNSPSTMTEPGRRSGRRRSVSESQENVILLNSSPFTLRRNG